MIIQCPQCQSRYNTSGENAGKQIQCRCGVAIFIPKLANVAKAWHCSNCGASVDPNKQSCDYCHAYLAFARCPACFSIAPYKGARFCTECGESLTLAVKPIQHRDAQLPCPRCDSSLQSKLVDKHLVEVCRDCGGVWISHKLLDELLQNEPLDSSSALGKPITKYPRLKLYEIRYLPCPECNKTMNRYNFMDHSNIILDECSEHGVWFDKHELAASLAFMRSYQSAASETPSQKPSIGSIDVAEDKEKATDVTYQSAEPIEIKEEDLSLLLKEFPHLFSANK